MVPTTSDTPQPEVQNDFASMRRVMVESQLRPSDVNDPVVISAMAVTPREDFVPESRRQTAYTDRAVPLGAGGRVLNPPLSTGLMLDRAQLRHDDHVLIIGSATGYLAALLAPLVRSVVALEEDASFAGDAASQLSSFGNITPASGDLTKGHSRKGPYSLIIIDGAVEQLPDTIIKQLDENGRLLTGMVENGVTRIAMGHKRNGTFGLTPFADSDIMALSQFVAPKSYKF